MNGSIIRTRGRIYASVVANKYALLKMLKNQFSRYFLYPYMFASVQYTFGSIAGMIRCCE